MYYYFTAIAPPPFLFRITITILTSLFSHFYLSFRWRAHSRPLSSITTEAPSTAAPSTISSTLSTTYATTPIPVLLAAKAPSEENKPSSSASYAAPIKVVIDNVPTESHIEEDKSGDSESTSENSSAQLNNIEEIESDQDDLNEQSHTEEKLTEEIPEQNDDLEEDVSEKIEETTSVEQRLRKITEEIEKYSNLDNESEIHGRQSFFSLSDLIKTLRPADKKITPQIDSDYSNTMHVLGETASIVNGDDSRKIKDVDLRQTNRALY